YRMEDIAVELIRSGAAVNITDLDGNTPLHLAARSSPDRVIRLLIKKGASPYLKNNEGKTALDIAREAHQQGNVDCLKKSKPKK
ncbi:MAG: ankyrin repeat domain-containing protein, partial [Smithellaceae bacterium]